MACVASDNPCVIAGDDLIYALTYTEADKITPIPLTGATAKMDLRESVTDVAVAQSMSGGITSATEGKMEFTLTDVETAALLPRSEVSKNFTFSVKITFQDSSEQTILTGLYSFEQAATE
tara:strand:+ start:35 stop:394 length:360 start_codon:yes stop_codon:yes gene_type:complete